MAPALWGCGLDALAMAGSIAAFMRCSRCYKQIYSSYICFFQLAWHGMMLPPPLHSTPLTLRAKAQSVLLDVNLVMHGVVQRGQRQAALRARQHQAPHVQRVSLQPSEDVRGAEVAPPQHRAACMGLRD